MSEFTHFMAPLLQDFEAIVDPLIDERGLVPKGKEQAAAEAVQQLWQEHAELREAVELMLEPMVCSFFGEALDALGPAGSQRREYFFKYYDEYVPRFKDSDPERVVDFATDLRILISQALVSSLFYCARPHLTLKQSDRKVHMWHFHHIFLHLKGQVLRHVTKCILNSLLLKIAEINPEDPHRQGAALAASRGKAGSEMVAVIESYKVCKSLSADDRDMLDVLVSLFTSWMESQGLGWESMGYAGPVQRGVEEYDWLISSVERSIRWPLLKRAGGFGAAKYAIEHAVKTYDASKGTKLSTWARYSVGRSLPIGPFEGGRLERDGYFDITQAAAKGGVSTRTVMRYIKQGKLKPRTYKKVFGKAYYSARLGRRVKLYVFTEKDIKCIRDIARALREPFPGHYRLKTIIDELYADEDLDLASLTDEGLRSHIRRLEKKGTIQPKRGPGGVRRYSPSDYKKIRQSLARRFSI